MLISFDIVAGGEMGDGYGVVGCRWLQIVRVIFDGIRLQRIILYEFLQILTAKYVEVTGYQIEWRQVLRKEKFQELRNDVGSLQQYHTQNVQRKKDIIRCIQDETANLQKLYHGAMVANINHMENMIAIHDEQVILLEKSFRERLASMQSEFEQDVELITTQYDHEKEIVQQCIDKHDEKESMLQMEQDRELDEIKARHKGNDVKIKRNLDLAVKNFQEQFEQTHEEYSRRNHVTRKIYEELKLKDDEVKQKISETTRRADHIRSKVQRIQLLAQKEKHQRQEQHRILLERKTRALETFQLIKDDMTKFRKNQQEKLVALSLRANERKESLQKQCEVAERVKKIADRCRQLETSREQFASMLRELPTTSPHQQQHQPQQQHQEEPHDDDDDEHDEQQDDSNDVRNEASKLVAEQKKAASKSVALTSFGDSTQERTLLWDTTARFWDKYNLAQVDVLRLQKRILELKQKEQELQHKLTICRNGVTVNDDVMKERNPLLVINGKMNTLIPSQEKKKKRLTVVEGNHFLRHNDAT